MADGVPADVYNVQEMQQAIMALQQEVLHLRAAAAGVEQDINAHVQQVVQNQVAAAVAGPAAAANQPAFGRARANAPDNWHGDPNDITLNDWTAQLLTYFECTNTRDPRQQVLVGAGCLRGAAGTWWRTRYDEYLRDGRPLPEDVNQLVADLRLHFGRIYQNADFRREWTTIRQGSKNVADYTHEFKQVAMQVEDTNEGEKLFRYVDGLNSRLKVRVEIERPQTLERAIELAAAWEGPLSHYSTERLRSSRTSDRLRSSRRNRSVSRHRRHSHRREYERAPRGDAMELGQRTARVRFREDDRTHRRRSGSRGQTPRRTGTRTADYQPRSAMKADSARRTNADIGARRAETRRCFRCDRVGHLAADCRQGN